MTTITTKERERLWARHRSVLPAVQLYCAALPGGDPAGNLVAFYLLFFSFPLLLSAPLPLTPCRSHGVRRPTRMEEPDAEWLNELPSHSDLELSEDDSDSVSPVPARSPGQAHGSSDAAAAGGAPRSGRMFWQVARSGFVPDTCRPKAAGKREEGQGAPEPCHLPGLLTKGWSLIKSLLPSALHKKRERDLELLEAGWASDAKKAKLAKESDDGGDTGIVDGDDVGASAAGDRGVRSDRLRDEVGQSSAGRAEGPVEAYEEPRLEEIQEAVLLLELPARLHSGPAFRPEGHERNRARMIREDVRERLLMMRYEHGDDPRVIRAMLRRMQMREQMAEDEFLFDDMVDEDALMGQMQQMDHEMRQQRQQREAELQERRNGRRRRIIADAMSASISVGSEDEMTERMENALVAFGEYESLLADAAKVRRLKLAIQAQDWQSLHLPKESTATQVDQGSLVAPDAAAVLAELSVQPSGDDACSEPNASSSVAVLADRLLEANCEVPNPTEHLTAKEKAAAQAKAFDEAQRSFTRLQKQMLQLVELEVHALAWNTYSRLSALAIQLGRLRPDECMQQAQDSLPLLKDRLADNTQALQEASSLGDAADNSRRGDADAVEGAASSAKESEPASLLTEHRRRHRGDFSVQEVLRNCLDPVQSDEAVQQRITDLFAKFDAAVLPCSVPNGLENLPSLVAQRHFDIHTSPFWQQCVMRREDVMKEKAEAMACTEEEEPDVEEEIYVFDEGGSDSDEKEESDEEE